ncbi:hypothetical protein [Faunimonas pinastri]|nr:hypothetical protein [Faunimonas pinastri]
MSLQKRSAAVLLAFSLAALPLIGLPVLGQGAAAAQSAPAAKVNMQPGAGSAGSTVRLSGTGIGSNSDVQIMGGQDERHLAPIGTAKSDARGGVKAQVQVPGNARNGKPYFFGLRANDTTTVATPGFNVRPQATQPRGGA